MDIKSLLRKLRKYEVQIRKAVKSPMAGEMKSVFKGTGIEFDDVRPYQYGDDVRNIDWNVTAKGHGAYIKTFKEDKDQSVFIAVDVSDSQSINEGKKLHIAKEIAGVLSMASANLGSQIGLLGFSDRTEIFIKPKKGKLHAYEIITRLFSLKNKSHGTSLNAAFKSIMGVAKRTSLVIVISDFLDKDYESSFRLVAQKHDLVLIHVVDDKEKKAPRLGIAPVMESETKTRRWANTSFSGLRTRLKKQQEQTSLYLQELCKKQQVDYVQVDTENEYVQPLVQLFKKRNLTWKRAS